MLPVIIAAGIGIGYLVKKNSRQSVLISVSQVKEPLTLEERNKAVFLCSLIGASANADAKITDEEKNELKKHIDSLNNSWLIDADLNKKLYAFIDNPVSITELKNIYSSLKSPDEKDIEQYRNIVFSIISADSVVTDEEKAFAFKTELIFENLPDMKLIKYSDTVDTDKEYLECLCKETIMRHYPLTDTNILNTECFYTSHPASKQELVSFDYFFNDSFATSKDTELINAARLAGAQRVTVKSLSKEISKDSLGIKSKTDIGVNNKSGGIDITTASSSMLDLEESSSLKFEFQGKRPGLFADWQGRNEKTILSNSKWLQFDPALVQFVKSCFGQNRITNFTQVVDYMDIGNSISSAGIAGKCKFPGISVKQSGEFKKNAEAMRHRKIEYTVSFENN